MEIKIEDIPEGLIPEKSILAGFRGSIAHNTYVPQDNPDSIDDIDLMSVYMAPVEYYIGLGHGGSYRKGKQTINGKFDCVKYELKHFINLALKSNPTILSLLWIEDKHYLKVSDEVRVLLDNKELFSSKKAYMTFTGYAASQLRRMKRFNYEGGYMGAKRKALVDKYGYDCKNASHLIRLLSMGIEFLSTGRLNVFRTTDAEALIDIKTGKWDIEKVKSYAEELRLLTKEAHEKSPLPEEPNQDKIEEILMEIIGKYVYKEYYE